MRDQAERFFQIRRKLGEIFDEGYNICMERPPEEAFGLRAEFSKIGLNVLRQVDEFACRAGFVEKILAKNELLNAKKSGADQS